MIYFYDDGHHELYNLVDDIGEAHDLSAEYPEKVRQLSKVLGKRLRKMQAQRPTFSASGRPCLWPDDVWNKE